MPIPTPTEIALAGELLEERSYLVFDKASGSRWLDKETLTNAFAQALASQRERLLGGARERVNDAFDRAAKSLWGPAATKDLVMDALDAYSKGEGK